AGGGDERLQPARQHGRPRGGGRFRGLRRVPDQRVVARRVLHQPDAGGVHGEPARVPALQLQPGHRLPGGLRQPLHRLHDGLADAARALHVPRLEHVLPDPDAGGRPGAAAARHRHRHLYPRQGAPADLRRRQPAPLPPPGLAGVLAARGGDVPVPGDVRPRAGGGFPARRHAGPHAAHPRAVHLVHRRDPDPALLRAPPAAAGSHAVSAVLILAWVMAVPARLLEVRSESVEGRPAVVVVAAGPLEEVAVKRDGADVVLSVRATAPEPIAAPAVAAPLEALRIVRTPGGVEVRVRVPPAVTYEVRREVARVVLLFGAAPAAPPPTSGGELYRGLFPPAPEGPEAVGSAGAAVPPGAPPAGVPERTTEAKPEGLHVGTLTFKPSVTLSYVDADVSVLDTPQTVRDRYAEARPALGIDIPLRDGLLGLDYEARIRRYSAFAAVNGVTHQGNA